MLAAVVLLAAGCGPRIPGGDPAEPRAGTADDVVRAAVAEAPRAALLLPFEAKRAEADLARVIAREPGSAAPRPATPHPRSLCVSIGDPDVGEPVARFVQDRAGASAGSWQLVLAGPLVEPPPGPRVSRPSRRARRPVRLVVQSTGSADRAAVSIEAGGWALCALPSLRLLVDGQPLHQLYAKPTAPSSASVDLGVNVTSSGARFSLTLPTELLATIVAAAELEISWDQGRIALRPREQAAVQALAAELDRAAEPALVPSLRHEPGEVVPDAGR